MYILEDILKYTCIKDHLEGHMNPHYHDKGKAMPAGFSIAVSTGSSFACAKAQQVHIVWMLLTMYAAMRDCFQRVLT